MVIAPGLTLNQRIWSSSLRRPINKNRTAADDDYVIRDHGFQIEILIRREGLG